ncbi:MAG TPA: lipocalin-like domain-containing protein [Thermoanaerobaculia bacterium]|jgi:predicted secreted hydrolase
MRRILSVFVIAGAVLAAARAGTSPAPTPSRTPPSARLQLPRDSPSHASHPDATLEWWYWTGHLRSDDGRAYGFQLTFFRLRDLHLAHFAWSDIGGGTFAFAQKTHLGLPGIAGASASHLDAFNEDWFAREVEQRRASPFAGKQVLLHARGPSGMGELSLTLTPEKPPVLHGENGISRKGAGPDDYSHYVSITRLAASGTWTAEGRTRSLHGDAWFDHEWGPGGLPAGVQGWDWFALQLSDGSELMLYRMRTANGGGASPFSAGTFVPKTGAPTPISWKDVRLEPRTRWTSPHSKATYPAVWSLAIASLSLDVTITPLLADQELSTAESTGVTYWEGACKVEGARAGSPVGGRAYVEMTGYAGRDVPGFSAP